MTKEEAKKKYKTIDDIPPLVFSNRYCTKTPSVELNKFLRVMHTHFPDDLRFLWRHAQQYTEYGLASRYTFGRWLNLLDRNLKSNGY